MHKSSIIVALQVGVRLKVAVIALMPPLASSGSLHESLALSQDIPATVIEVGLRYNGRYHS